MLSAIAEKWYSLNKLTIRKYDKHHLIFGDKLNGNLPIPDYILPILQRNVDAIFIQWYGRFEEQAETLNRVYSITGKPILMGDSSFSVVQKNQKHSKGIHVNSQEEVGDEYAKYLKQLTSLPYIVGWHYCGYVEGWDGLRAFDENHPFVSYQCGFKTPSGEVHEKAVERVRAANSRVRSY